MLSVAVAARSPDFARTASDYARHRAGFPAELQRWLTDPQEARFAGIETFSFDVQVPYSHEAWVGRIRASGPIAGTLEEAGVEACSRELTTVLAERFPEDPLTIPHRVWAVTARVPAS